MSGSHDPKQWNRQWSLVHRALELPDDAARQAFLEAECMDDPVLRREIEDLMQAAAQAGDFLATPPTDPNRPQIKREEVAADSGWIGRRIGRYTIRRRIAAGGMGVVFEAVQERPKRAVALKIMRGGITSRSAMRRFEYEAQTLARLRHPHIAQIFEAGTHDDGRGALPYFAMEYVPNARTLIEFALERKLGTRERIELFRRVCDAVHHGHQRGIIHRDLKPSNILVDSNGDPKVIDFGVARATDSDLAVTTLQTDVGQLIGTLQYMSPEQCDADPHDLDTRSDVYALGVVLYELLTEEAPYDVTTVPLFEAPRIIKTTPPRRPSTFSRTVRGDLETVLMKALEKERERRYQTAAEFAQDLQRYLHQEPIIARPASASYQMQMFVRRHRPIVAAGSVAVAALVIATVVSTVFGIAQQQALTREREANEAADQARLEREQGVRAAVATLVLALQDASGVNADGDRNEEKNNMARLAAFRESLEAAAAQMLSRFEGDPIGQAEILAGVANGLRQGGLFEIAEPYIRDAVEKRTSAAPLDARGLGLMLQHAYLLIDLGRFPEAKEIISTAMTADIEWSESFQEELLNLRSLYLWTSSDEREADEVVADYRNLAADFEAFWGDEHRNALWQLNLAARVYARAGEPEKSIALYRDVIRHADRHPDMGPLDGWTWAWRGNMAASMIDAGRCEEAEVILSMLVEQAEEEIEGLSDHPDGVRTRNLWAKALACLDRREDAIAIWKEAIAFGEAAEGFPVHYTAGFKRSLAEHLVEWGQAEQAILLLRDAEAVYVAQQGEGNEDVARVRRALDAAREALDENP